MNEVQEKQIQITNLNIRVVSPKPGQTFANGSADPFNVYEVTGNDGIKYETFDTDWYNARAMGEQITIKYAVNTTAGNNGRVYTNYKLQTKDQVPAPVAPIQSPVAPVVQATPITQLSPDDTVKILRHLYQRVVLAEANILKALGVKPEVKEEVKEELPIVQVAEETQVPANEVKPIPQDDDIEPPVGLPF